MASIGTQKMMVNDWEMNEEVTRVSCPGYQPRVIMSALEASHGWGEACVQRQGTVESFLVYKLLFAKEQRKLDFLRSNYIIMPQVPPGYTQRINGPTSLIYFLGSQGLLPQMSIPSALNETLEDWKNDCFSQRWAWGDCQPLGDALGHWLGNTAVTQAEGSPNAKNITPGKQGKPSNYFHSKVGNE